MQCSGRKCLDFLQLFQRLDAAKVGSIPLSQMRRYFRGNAHPDVTGERGRTAGEVEAAFIELFQTKRIPVHRSQPAQTISWAVSGGVGVERRGGEGGWGRGRQGRGKINREWEGEEGMVVGTCCAMCLILQEFEDYFEGQSIEFPSEEHFTAVVKACWTI